MSEEISKYSDIIDSRDVVDRLEDLNSQRGELITVHDDLVEELLVETNAEKLTALQEQVTEATEALTTWDDDFGDELKVLKALNDEGEAATSEWLSGKTLINENHFVAYAEQLAEDIGAIDPKAGWPLSYIDWKAAADELRSDYTEINFDGETFLVRA